GIGPPPSGEESGLQPLAAVADVLVVKLRPDLVLRAPRLGALVHPPHPGLAYRDRPAHQLEFVGRLAGACVFGDLLPFDDRKAKLAQQVGPERLAFVDCQSRAAAAMLLDE